MTTPTTTPAATAKKRLPNALLSLPQAVAKMGFVLDKVSRMVRHHPELEALILRCGDRRFIQRDRLGDFKAALVAADPSVSFVDDDEMPLESTKMPLESTKDTP